MPNLLVIASRLPSSDGLYHLRYPAGNAPIGGAALASSPSVASAVSGALSTGIKLAGAASVASSASASLTTSGGGVSFVPNGSYSLSGTISEGQLVTLTGSGFGSVGPQLLFYKNFANETAGTKVANGPDFGIAGISITGQGAGYPYVAAGSGLPYGQGMIISNDSRIGNEETPGAAYGGIVATYPSQIAEVFTTAVIYFPSSCNYTSIATSGTPQVKLDWLFCNKTGGGGFNDTDIYNGLDNQNISNAWIWQSNSAPWSSNLQAGTTTQWAWNSTPYPKTGVPIRNSRYIKISAAPGAGSGNILWTGVWDGSSQSINVYNNNQPLVASGSAYNGYQICAMPGFVQAGIGTDPNWSVANNRYVIEGELYQAGPSSGNSGAAARVEIGDASTYAACSNLSICTVESPSWWSSGQVEFRLRFGAFYLSGLSGKYLYVTDSSNTTTQVGHFQ